MQPIRAMFPLALAAAALAAPPAAAQQCEHSAERTASVGASGAALARVAARAGTLRIEGRADISEVRARGRACASSREYLEQLQLRAVREGDAAVLEVRVPEMRCAGNCYASLDLVVEVPSRLPVDASDSSGDLEIRRVASLRLRDSSGDASVFQVRGSVSITDSSGDVTVTDVDGDLLLNDSSGNLLVREVGGQVLVERDSSGDIRIDGVGGDVAVQHDSSGDIRVNRVRGSFTVARDGSGSIHHSDVAGAVRVPERKR